MTDLRSDTVTQPTEAMLDAMQSATFGDDSRDGDAEIDCALGVFAETWKQFKTAGGTRPGAHKNSKAADAEPAQGRS